MRRFDEVYLEGEVLEEALALHMKALPDDFLTLLGERQLRLYYSNLPLLYESVRSFKISDGGITGYVHYGCSPKLSLFAYFLQKSTFNLIKFVLLNPLYALDLLRYSFNKPDFKCELLYIYISSSGRGLGSELLRYSLRRVGVSEVFVKTLASTKKNVEFYKINGFVIQKEIVGRVILKIIL